MWEKKYCIGVLWKYLIIFLKDILGTEICFILFFIFKPESHLKDKSFPFEKRPGNLGEFYYSMKLILHEIEIYFMHPFQLAGISYMYCYFLLYLSLPP